VFAGKTSFNLSIFTPVVPIGTGRVTIPHSMAIGDEVGVAAIVEDHQLSPVRLYP